MHIKIILYLLCLIKDDLADTVRKYIHQRDVSEHCKRRVVPSVFLGQHVTDANSQVLQFSQLEVPYSCSLSVRAEAGSNIVLIAQFPSENSLLEACSLHGDQLIVYELGETFGGYWGPIPDVIMKEPAKNYTQFYTLKTTRASTQRNQKLRKTTQIKILKDTDVTESTIKEQEYFTMVVPIVNVSGNFQLGPPRETNDSEDLFNYIYDVTPRNGVEYETSILPLVQFSMRQQSEAYGGESPLYELEIDSKGFTMDPRLIFNTAKRKQSSFKRDWKANKRFRLKPKSTGIVRRRDSKKLFTARWPYSNEAGIYLKHTLDSNYFTNTWELVDDILKSVNVTTSKSTVFKNETFRNILHKISNSQHNSSVYLARNMSIYDVDISTKKNETIFQGGTDSNHSFGNYTKLVEIKPSALDMTATSLLSNLVSQATFDLSEWKTEYSLKSKYDKPEVNTTYIHEGPNLEGVQKDETNMTADEFYAKNELLTDVTTVPSTSTNQSTKNSFLTGAMVGHESWENIVQAAPVMAVVLNNTEPLKSTINNVFNQSKYKRHIQSLEIEQSRPRNLTTKPALSNETAAFNDIRDLAQLVELEDDQIGSRVALRYLRHYVGSALYNMCDHREHSPRQMFLFNSSRIVIALSNFTLERMMLVLTPAQTLSRGVSQCPGGQLECQIIGTRICIDALNACDGIPNCGSYEIYDEDRLTCGTAHGVQQSVCLAAFTFLAVILTAAYIILYWLERCVPRVSDAFFVYTDTSENELFLESIMRSPYDDDDPSNKMIYPGRFFDEDASDQDLNTEGRKRHFCKKMFNACKNLLGFRKVLTEKTSENVIPENKLEIKEPSRLYSFTQLELRKFGNTDHIDKEVQTGDSFEMQELKSQQNKQAPNSLSSLTIFKSMKYKDDMRGQDSELNLLKLSKESRSLSSQSNSLSYDFRTRRSRDIGIGTEGELEIKNTLYEHTAPSAKVPVICEVHNETKRMAESSKRLRFDEELKMITTIDEDDDNLPATSSTIQRLNKEGLGSSVEAQGAEGSGRDFMRFWGAKGKKSKKKKLKYLS